MKFAYTIIYVPDIEKAVSFYEQAFGLERSFIHESGYAEMKTGETKLAFASYQLIQSHGTDFTRSSRETNPPGVEIAFVTENVEAAFQKAVKGGALEVSAPSKKPWGQVISYVKDLNGFLVEICSPVS